MKTYFLTIAIILSTLISCDKNGEIPINKLAGTWKLIEVLADPGNGSGTFNSVNSDKKLIFDIHGNVASNGLICDMSIETSSSSSGTYIVSSSTIYSTKCSNSAIKYELNGNTLILIYPCIEACKSKYTKMQ